MLPNLILTTLGRKAMQKYLIKTLKPPSKTFKTTKKKHPYAKNWFPITSVTVVWTRGVSIELKTGKTLRKNNKQPKNTLKSPKTTLKNTLKKHS